MNQKTPKTLFTVLNFAGQSICPVPGIETALLSSTLVTELILPQESTSRVLRCLLFLMLNDMRGRPSLEM